ncbi:MAG: prepilin-type N-terminal cleavage/methylation domain-containing protein [Patescibacteria group bacterium]
MPRGFTLLELMLVMALLAASVLLTAPLGIDFLQAQKLDETASEIISELRRAHSQSVFQKNDSAFGVKFLSSSYVLFQGNSYDNRIQNNDERFILPTFMVVNGINEVVFSKLTGRPSVTGVISVVLRNKNKNIIINEGGVVEKQQ